MEETHILYLTLDGIVKKHPGITERFLRTLLADRENNGLDSAIIVPGKRKFLIDDDMFQAWLNSKRGGKSDGKD